MAELFGINIAGRVKNFKLNKNQALMPIFEAVVNSIQAIEDRRKADASFSSGSILIDVMRNETLPIDDKATGSVSSFTITDNGIGFNEENFRSFLQSDSTYKEQRGGKGVGRFCWLKVFSNARIESNYSEGQESYCRMFDFNLSTTSLDDAVSSATGEIGTKLILSGVRNEFAKALPEDIEEISSAIMHHCAVYLMLPDCPTITVKGAGGSISINEEFNLLFTDDGKKDSFEINGHSFELFSMKMPLESLRNIKTNKRNRVMFCANSRVVEEYELDERLKGLGAIIKEKHGFYYLGILTGQYLDENVDANRLSFSIAQEDDLFRDTGPTKREINDEVVRLVNSFLESYYIEAVENRKKSIDDFILTEAPQYKSVLKHFPEVVDQIKFGSDTQAVEDALHHGKRRLEKQLREKSAEFLDMSDNDILQSEEYLTEFEQQVKIVTDINMSTLAEYIARRKAVLNIFERSLRLLRTGKCNKESFLHELIFPMRVTDEDVLYDSHNLWLIDERLTYSTYLSSDISLGKDADRKRPDILCLSSPVLVTNEENTGREFNSVSIFELKRPMRDDYSESENPIDQLLEYIEKLQEGKVRDANGRQVSIGSKTRIFLYAVCDVTDSLRKLIRRKDLKEMPDGLGWFKNYESYNAYLEILPFDKIVSDAKARNRVFFEKLGL